MEEQQEPIKVMRDVTCHTLDCGNGEITISVISLEDSIIICGVCSQQITDIVEMGVYNA